MKFCNIPRSRLNVRILQTQLASIPFVVRHSEGRSKEPQRLLDVIRLTADTLFMAAVCEQVANLVSVVYVSSGVRHFEPEEILEILRTARRNNEKRQITGMLLYKDGNFLQVLEGTEQAITPLLQTIETDPRHRGMIQLIKKRIEERQFANWSMAFKHLDHLSPEDAAAYSPFFKESLLDEEFRSKPDRCYQLLLRFKESVR